MDGGMMMSDIMFEHLTKTYPNGFISVDDVTLKIQDGEFVVFHGPSGCGKSTILRMTADWKISHQERFILAMNCSTISFPATENWQWHSRIICFTNI